MNKIFSVNILKAMSSKKYFRYGILLVTGVFLGWLFFHSPHTTKEGNESLVQQGKATIWTCAMHPQIRMTAPGKCPICGMDLIPLNQSPAGIDEAAIHLSKEAAALANVQTSIVEKQKPIKEIRLYGKVQADERLLQSQVANISGRIDKLFVNFTGETIQKGKPLALIYSPELITTQQELLEAARTKQTQPEIYGAAREKLRRWKLTEAQINSIENSGNIQSDFEVLSNTSGIVIDRKVNNGDYFTAGTVLFDVADLSSVWVMFDAYESDLPFLNQGAKVNFTTEALPGINFSGNIKFIDPVIDPSTRVAQVRLEVPNVGGKLKPEMFVTGIVEADLAKYRDDLIIPASAVLWTGKRSIVYVKEPGVDEPVFKMREIDLGPKLGSSYVVLNGLKEGEEIVTNGTFSVDAASQLAGKPSMMNPEGGAVNTMPGMQMQANTGATIGSQMDTINMTAQNQENTAIGRPSKPQISMDFIMQLNEVFDRYIAMKNGFVDSDVQKVKQAAGDCQQALTNVDMKLLSGDLHLKWIDMQNTMGNALNSISSSDNIESQRMAFAEFSNQLYQVIKTFGLMDKTVYYQFCPMAFNNKGAYWLSELKEIRNPYFGKAMLTCGKTVETLTF